MSLMFCHWGYSQVGVGGLGAIGYPGLLSSKKYNIQFRTGFGYGFFIQHDAFSLKSGKINLRYIATIMNHKANLSTIEKSNYHFSNFSIDLLYTFFDNVKNKFYAGASLNLLMATSENKFRATYSGETIYPGVLAGWAYNFAEGFDVFTEFKAAFGSTDAGPEKIPITGISFFCGIIMYISE